MRGDNESTTDALARALARGPLHDIAQALRSGGITRVWVVGGTLRDLLLGRPTKDVDLAVAGDAKSVARVLHGHLGGDIFSLSDRFGTWRVQPAGRDWCADVSALRGASIEEDLAMRDFSVNAMALPLNGDAGASALVDPFAGLDDLASGVLRVLGEQAYADDPLRALRLPRLACETGLEPDAETAELTRRHAKRVSEAAVERVFAELRRLISSDGVLDGIELLERLELIDVVLPELVALRGVQQSAYHHLDAYDHTIEVLRRLLDLEADLSSVFGDAAEPLAERLAEPLSEGLTRGQGLRWAALLHDIAKRETRTEYDGGHVGFPGHDARGAEIVREIGARLHASERFTQYVSALTRHHLRLGFLVRERPLSRRQIFAYLRACEPVEVEVGVLSVADRLATRGRKAEVAIAAHLKLAAELNREALAWREVRAAEPLVRGDRLADELGIPRDRRLGELLDLIAEARFAGEISTPEEALALARAQL